MGKGQPRTALLVASSLVEATRLRQVLLECGLERVFLAWSQAEALTLLKQEPVELVLSPWENPEFSARDMIHSLKAKGKHKQVPVLILDGGMSKAAVVAAVKAGVAGRVPIPAEKAQLEEILAVVRSEQGSLR